METVNIIINDKKIETQSGKTVLDAALEAGIYIPNLCRHPNLKPVGACQLCVVEIEGQKGVATSCTLTAKDGMVVRTKTPKLESLRRLLMEMMLAGHPSECTGCPKYGKCEFAALIQYLEVNDAHLRKKHDSYPLITSNPLYVQDLGKCILCGRCVRACREMRGVKVWNYNHKDGRTYIGTPGDISMMENACKFCGACAEVCPTGAIRDKDGALDPAIPRKDALVPCRYACPAHTDAPRYLRYIREGQYSKATAVIREKAPFPLVLGHVCVHPCETACRRNELGEAVSIKELKRFAAEHDDKSWKKRSRVNPPTGKKVAAIGSGPAGLTAAFYLAKQGHETTVFEKMPQPGGMLRYGVPEYRLPANVIASEIEDIKEFGVSIVVNKKVESAKALLDEGFDAVLIAVGAEQGVRLPIPGAQSEGVLLNLDMLKSVRLGQQVALGEKVIVIGGGNVAFDCARVARRMGAKDVHIACLESREAMTASREEIEEGEQEGIVIHNSKTFLEITCENGRATGVKWQDVKAFSFDEAGRLQLNVAEGTESIMPADTVIFAVGQRPKDTEAMDVELERGNRIKTDADTMASSITGVFAAGDVVTGTLSVIEAIAAGRKAAESIDRFLGGDGNISEALATVDEPSVFIGREEGFGLRPRGAYNLIEPEKRIQGFMEVDKGLDEEGAHKDAERCLQCDLRTCITNPKFWMDYAEK